MIDETIIQELNSLIDNYTKKNYSDNDRISYLLQLLMYQSWDIKSKLKIIEKPDLLYKTTEMKEFRSMFGPDNAFSKYQLIIPLLVFLFIQHNKSQPALNSALSFMESSKDYLRAGDFAKTKTGVQRFITNTRFAALELRNFGLLRSDKKHFYKYWSLSPFGIILASKIFFDFKDDKSLYKYKSLTWENANSDARLFIIAIVEDLNSKVTISKLFNDILSDEIITEHFNLTSSLFLSFKEKIISVLSEGYNPKKNKTKNLVEFINSINADIELSKFADSIILKKEIDMNMSRVYTILNL